MRGSLTIVAQTATPANTARGASARIPALGVAGRRCLKIADAEQYAPGISGVDDRVTVDISLQDRIAGRRLHAAGPAADRRTSRRRLDGQSADVSQQRQSVCRGHLLIAVDVRPDE